MMKELTTTITQRGQVTIPAQVRRLLQVKPRDKVAFTITQTNEVHLAPASFTLESAYGSVKPSRRPENFKGIARAAKEEKADQTLKELRRR